MAKSDECRVPQCVEGFMTLLLITAMNNGQSKGMGGGGGENRIK